MIEISDSIILTYLDPGTGSAIFQMITAFFVAIFFSLSKFRMYLAEKFQVLKGLFKKNGKKIKRD